jgi:hypothetical protein
MQQEETLGHKEWSTKNNLKHNLRLKQKKVLWPRFNPWQTENTLEEPMLSWMNMKLQKLGQ